MSETKFYGEMPSNEIVAIQKEIDMLRNQRVEAFKRLYDLGLAPFHGYYEMLLRNHEKNVRTL